MLIDFENILLTKTLWKSSYYRNFFPSKLIALPMKETLDKQGMEEEKWIVVKDIAEEGELVKENEEKNQRDGFCWS